MNDYATLEEFLEAVEALEPYRVQAFFDPVYDGGCPCFRGQKRIGEGLISVAGRCWRVAEQGQDLRVGGSLLPEDLARAALAVKKKLDEQEWYMKYTVILDEA